MIVQEIEGGARRGRGRHLEHHRRAADIGLVRDGRAARHHLMAAARHIIGRGGAGLVHIHALEAAAVRPVGERNLARVLLDHGRRSRFHGDKRGKENLQRRLRRKPSMAPAAPEPQKPNKHMNR
jgi:hypothetical protein